MRGTRIFTVAILALALAGCGKAPRASTASPQAAAPKILYWVDPMHPAYTSDKPGKAPDCGMDLVPVFEKSAEKQAEKPVEKSAVELSPREVSAAGVATAV